MNLAHTLATVLTVAPTATVFATPTSEPPLQSPEAVDRILSSAKPGDLVLLPGIEAMSLVRIPWLRQPIGNIQFLLSDMPEYLPFGDGICMQEKVKPGRVRLFLYHVSQSPEGPKVITTTIENLGKKPLVLTFHAYASATPGSNYRAVSQLVNEAWLSNTPYPHKPRTLMPGQCVVLDPALDRRVTTSPDLVFGVYEFSINQPAKITVLQCDPAASATEILVDLPRFPRKGGAGRGLFENADCDVRLAPNFSYDTASGPRLLLLADGKEDPWLVGRDSTYPDQLVTAPVKGNYGALYRFQMPFTSSDGRGLAVLIQNTMGAHPHKATRELCACSSATLKVSDGRSPGGVVKIPATPGCIAPPPQAGVVQTYGPAQGGTFQVVDLVYTPPAGSCLPIAILLVPFHLN